MDTAEGMRENAEEFAQLDKGGVLTTITGDPSGVIDPLKNYKG